MARILIAEDDSSMRQFLQQALERAGHSVEACADGLAARTALEHDAGFDLLLADIVMPGMDGIELARAAAALRPSLKIMFITGFAGVALTAAASEGAALPAPVMSKPFHLGDLVRQIETLLATGPGL